ncbi:MAG: glycerol-3-phosphate acyltransferase, partial [Chloroflexota bacterium]
MDTTPTFTVFFFAAFIAYILGALPSAYTVARLNGINIFEVGSHQAGATNVWREVSRKMGMVVTAVDFAKGVMAIVAGYLIGLEASELLVP